MSSTPMSASRRILLIWEQGGNLGHLVRLREISAQIRSRGGVPVWVVPSKFIDQPLISAADERFAVPVVSFGERKSLAAGPTSMPESFADVLLNIGFSDPRALGDALGQWSKLFDQLRPDAVVCDYSPVALLAACCHGIPAVHLTNGFDAPPGSFPPFLGGLVSPSAGQAIERSAENLAHSIRESSGAVGQARTLDDYLSWSTKLHDGVPETDPYGVRPGIHHIGPITLEGAPLPSEWAQSACVEGKRVFAYLRGSVASVLMVLWAN